MQTPNSEIQPALLPFEELLDLAAHDLQSPLRKLAVLTDRLVSKFPTDNSKEAEEYVQRIQHCVQEMQGMVAGLVHLGKLEQTELKMESCDLEKVLQQEIKILTPTLLLTQIETNIEADAVVEADIASMRLLLRELLTNAIKFRNIDEVLQINIKGHASTVEEKSVAGLPIGKEAYTILIYDNGIGFDPENSSIIFQPFVRLNGKSSYHGSGLGLTLCQKIVSGHQGWLYAEGEEKKGSRFTIILPKQQPN